MSKSKAARIEQSAAWSVMRADRRFLWLWLTVATSMSLGANVGHAWLTQTTTPFGLRIAAAVMAPILLLMAIHGLPTLARMLERDERDRLLSFVVWGVVIGAFAWSAVGIFHFAVSCGIPPQLAWVAPYTIDLSVFGATRALVLTTPIAARMKTELAENAAVSPSPRPVAAVTHRAAPVPAPAPVRADAMVVLPASPVTVGADASGDAPSRESQASTVVRHENAAVTTSPSAPVDGADDTPTVTQEHLDRAAFLAQRGTVAKPVEEIAVVLAQWEGGVSERRISNVTGWSTNTIRKLRRDADSASALTAV
jgi:hypothetical protein